MGSPLRIKLYRFQKIAAGKALIKKSYALFMEQGTGKTPVTLWVIGKRWRRDKIRYVVIICPKTVIGSWVRQIEKHLIPKARICTVDDVRRNKARVLRKMRRRDNHINFLIINYESAWRLDNAFWRHNPDMIVCDESHRIKGRNTKVSKRIGQLGFKAKYRMILTGTPIGNEPSDVWAQFRFLKRELFGDRWGDFKAKYLTSYSMKLEHITLTKTYMIKQMRKIFAMEMAPFVYRILKKDARVLGLPETMEQPYHYDVDKDSRKMYNDLNKDLVLYLKETGFVVTAPHLLTKMLRLQQLTGGFLKPDDEEEVIKVNNHKLDLVLDLMRDSLHHKKVVIFCRFIPELLEIEKQLKKSKYTVGTLYGKTKDRTIWEKFQDDKDPQILICQIQTGGEGIDLHAADTAIFYSVNFSYLQYEQAKARLDRIGQKNPVTFIHLLQNKSIDILIWNALKRKGQIADSVLSQLKEEYHGEEDENQRNDD